MFAVINIVYGLQMCFWLLNSGPENRLGLCNEISGGGGSGGGSWMRAGAGVAAKVATL